MRVPTDLARVGTTENEHVAYRTSRGRMVQATIEEALDSGALDDCTGEVALVFTSPPFPLHRKKRYGNRTGDEYLDWLADLAPRLVQLLKPDGSVVVEIGNAWEPGRPVMSLLPLQALMAFAEKGGLNVCQQFVCHNPARLPTPAQWVTVKRIRVKDSYTNVWWMAPSDRPKADNRKVLTEYSDAMRRLLDTQTYNAGRRSSGHMINETSFLRDNGGAIPPNVLIHANTRSADPYRTHCERIGVTPHPAPMQRHLAEFFIRFLTDEGDLVLDPFAGSNMTGAVAEENNRRWVAVEPDEEYVDGSVGRFDAASVLTVR